MDPPDPPLSECDNVLCVVLIDENEQTGSNWASKFTAFEQTYPNRVLLVLDVAPGQVALNVPFLDSTRATSLRYEFDQDPTSLIRNLERDNGDNAIATSNNPYLRVTTLLSRLSLTTWFNDDCQFVDILVSDDGGMTEEQVQSTIIKLRTDLLSNGYNSRQRTFDNDDFICPFLTQDCCSYSNQEALETACGVNSPGGNGFCQPLSVVFTQQPNDCTKEDYGCEGLPPEPGAAVYGTCVTNECDQIDNVRFTASAYGSTGQEYPWVEIDYTLQYSDDNGENWSDSTSDFGEDFSGEPQQISSLLSDWPDQEGNGDHDWLDATFESYSSTPVGTLGCVKNTFDRIFRIKAETVDFFGLEPVYSDTFTLFFWTLEEVSDLGEWVEISNIPKNCGLSDDFFTGPIPIDQRSGGRFADWVNPDENKFLVPIDPTRLAGQYCFHISCIGRNRPYANEPPSQYLLQAINLFSLGYDGMCVYTGNCGNDADFGSPLGYDEANDWIKGWTFDPEADPDPNRKDLFYTTHIINDNQGMTGQTHSIYGRVFYNAGNESIDYIEPYSVEDSPPTYNGNSVSPIRSYIKEGETYLYPNSLLGPTDDTKISDVAVWTLGVSDSSSRPLFAIVNGFTGNNLSQSFVSEYGILGTAPITNDASRRPANTYVLEHDITGDGQNGYRIRSTALSVVLTPSGTRGFAIIMIPGFKIVNGDYQFGTLVYRVARNELLPTRYPVYKFIPGRLFDSSLAVNANKILNNDGTYSHHEILVQIQKTNDSNGNLIGDQAKENCTFKFRSDVSNTDELVNEFNLLDNDDLNNFGLAANNLGQSKLKWLGFGFWGIVFPRLFPDPVNGDKMQNEIMIKQFRNNQLYTYPSTIKGGKVPYNQDGSTFGVVPNLTQFNSVAFHRLADNMIAVYHYNEFDPSVPDLVRVFLWRPV